jgi:hypothetical protein
MGFHEIKKPCAAEERTECTDNLQHGRNISSPVYI